MGIKEDARDGTLIHRYTIVGTPPHMTVVRGNMDTPESYPDNVVVDTSGAALKRNAAGIESDKLHQSPGRPKGARNLHAKHPSSISRAFKKAGLNWQIDFALAIKANNRARIKLWLKLLPYLITQTNKTVRVKRWKGRASKAALIALDALEGR